MNSPAIATAKAVPQTVLSLKGVKKHFVQGDTILEVLKEVDLEVKAGEIIALVGPSGAGKSTLLHIVGLLERPDDGVITLDSSPCQDADDNARTALRREYLGFVYQYHNLLADFSALENVMIPQMIAGKSRKKTAERATWLLEKMGLGARLTHRPAELSGGEQQRVAIARALVNMPKLLLADEPTGNLDPNTSKIVFDELLKLVRDTGLSAIIATHNPELAAKMDRKITLRDGKLIEITNYLQERMAERTTFVNPKPSEGEVFKQNKPRLFDKFKFSPKNTDKK